MKELKGHRQQVRVLCGGFGRVWSGGDDGQVMGWGIPQRHNGTPVQTSSSNNKDGEWGAAVMPGGHKAGVLGLCASYNDLLCSASADHTIKLWDPTVCIYCLLCCLILSNADLET